MHVSADNASERTINLAFASVKGMNPLFASSLLERIGDKRQFFTLSEKALCSTLGVNNSILKSDYRQKLLDDAAKEANFIDANNIRVTFYDEESYPNLLTECDDAPMAIYSLGAHNFNRGIYLSIVGTRHATPYGLNFTDHLVEYLSKNINEPITIVSGLAFGIDIAAHSAAMKYGLPTVAVLAHGLNTIYPAQHRNAAADIIKKGGLLMTEYTSAAAIHKGNFLARNRIVAGISNALIVVESARKGGALITAKIASDYQRDIFALPGRTSDIYSQGCNHLIASHIAQLIQSPEELAEAMRWPCKESEPVQQKMFSEPLSPQEKSIIDYLTLNSDASINQISVNCNITIGKLTAMLIDMELRGLLLKYPGARYRLA